jgi:predicted nucleic acid-binding protein
MNYLLDTCVVSEMVSRHPNKQVLIWLDSVAETRLYLSVITIGEIRRGIEKLPDSQRRVELEDWLRTKLLPRFSERLVTVDAAVMLRWGELVGALEKRGKSMPAIDSLIAASALQAGLSLVARNERDFAESGVEMVNPWQ